VTVGNSSLIAKDVDSNFFEGPTSSCVTIGCSSLIAKDVDVGEAPGSGISTILYPS